MVTETGETIDITPSWEFAALAYATNLLDGTDYKTRRESHDEIISMGRTLDAVLAFVEFEGHTAALKEYLREYPRRP